jgi:hypothetical protein
MACNWALLSWPPSAPSSAALVSVRGEQRDLAGVGQHAGGGRGQARDCGASDLLAALPAIGCGHDPARPAGVPLSQRLQRNDLVEERLEIIQPEHTAGPWPSRRSWPGTSSPCSASPSAGATSGSPPCGAHRRNASNNVRDFPALAARPRRPATGPHLATPQRRPPARRHRPHGQHKRAPARL